MPSDTFRGDCQIKLANVALDLQYKTRNLRHVAKFCSRSAMKIVQDLQDDPGMLIDPDLFIPLVAAGLVHHTEYRRTTAEALQTKIEYLVDRELEGAGPEDNIATILAPHATTVMEAFLAGLGIKAELTSSAADTETEAGAVATGKPQVTDASPSPS